MNGDLGGRLPLVDADTLDAAQRELFDRLQATVVPWSDATGFRSTTADASSSARSMPPCAARRWPAPSSSYRPAKNATRRCPTQCARS